MTGLVLRKTLRNILCLPLSKFKKNYKFNIKLFMEPIKFNREIAHLALLQRIELADPFLKKLEKD